MEAAYRESTSVVIALQTVQKVEPRRPSSQLCTSLQQVGFGDLHSRSVIDTVLAVHLCSSSIARDPRATEQHSRFSVAYRSCTNALNAPAHCSGIMIHHSRVSMCGAVDSASDLRPMCSAGRQAGDSLSIRVSICKHALGGGVHAKVRQSLHHRGLQDALAPSTSHTALRNCVLKL